MTYTSDAEQAAKESQTSFVANSEAGYEALHISVDELAVIRSISTTQVSRCRRGHSGAPDESANRSQEGADCARHGANGREDSVGYMSMQVLVSQTAAIWFYERRSRSRAESRKYAQPVARPQTMLPSETVAKAATKP